MCCKDSLARSVPIKDVGIFWPESSLGRQAARRIEDAKDATAAIARGERRGNPGVMSFAWTPRSIIPNGSVPGGAAPTKAAVTPKPDVPWFLLAVIGGAVWLSTRS